MLVTLVPMVYLLATSFTPLNLTNPATAWNFRQPMANYALLLHDTRFHNSLWVQAKLSFWTVGLQLLIGVGFALLLNMRSGLLRALRTVFLIPMVLPPIVVAIIWKVLYTPDISPMYWALQGLGLNVPALITDPTWALPAIIAADTWEWFPLTMLMVLAALQTLPDELLDAAKVDGARHWQTTLYVVLPYIRGTLMVAGLSLRLIDSIQEHFPLILSADLSGGPGSGDRGDQLLRLRTGLQFFLFGIFQRDHRRAGGGDLGAQLGDRAPDRMGWRGMRTNRLIIHALVLVLVALVLAPFLWLLRMSFETNADIFAFPPKLWFAPTVANYAALWRGGFPHSFAQQRGWWSITSTAVSMIVGVPAAHACWRGCRHGPTCSACGLSPAGWRRRLPSRFRISWRIAICICWIRGSA